MTHPPIFPNLDHRADMSEKMDSPESDQRKLENTLYLFGVVNRGVARVRHVLKKHVVNVMRQNPHREYHLIDLGAGACEMDSWLLEQCQSENLQLRISACDHDQRVVRHARKRFGDLAGLDILQRDVRELGDLKPADFIFANHLLHHLSDRQIVELLETLAEFTEATVLIDDIIRSRLAYIAYYAASLFFPRRSFARYDGLLSIMKGFREPEIRRYIQQSPPDHQNLYTIQKLFPYRLLVIREPLSLGGIEPLA